MLAVVTARAMFATFEFYPGPGEGPAKFDFEPHFLGMIVLKIVELGHKVCLSPIDGETGPICTSGVFLLVKHLHSNS